MIWASTKAYLVLLSGRGCLHDPHISRNGCLSEVGSGGRGLMLVQFTLKLMDFITDEEEE